MKPLLRISGLLLLACLAVRGQNTNSVSTNEFFRVQMTVLDIVQLRTYKGPVTATNDADPRFALTVRIDSSVPPLANLKSGSILTFAVHSPSLSLGGSAKKGETFEFRIPRKKAMALTPHGLANPQGRANGRQPFNSETNRTSAAAASRRSP
jgi:hypothetical protein